MWPKEAEGKFCFPYVPKHNNDQTTCQSLCLESATCVGISVGITKLNLLCLLCNGDELRPHKRYAFYRRPGNTYNISE